MSMEEHQLPASPEGAAADDAKMCNALIILRTFSISHFWSCSRKRPSYSAGRDKPWSQREDVDFATVNRIFKKSLKHYTLTVICDYRDLCRFVVMELYCMSSFPSTCGGRGHLCLAFKVVSSHNLFARRGRRTGDSCRPQFLISISRERANASAAHCCPNKRSQRLRERGFSSGNP